MVDDLLGLDDVKKQYSSKATISEPLESKDINLNGLNEDFTEVYFWHINFAYYVYKGYTALKMEDYHYFSEASQFGGNYRQIKGGSIRAFQENFQQLITLVRQHLIPLLKEIKEAHFYVEWFNQITENDALYHAEKKKKGADPNRIKGYKDARDEALNHMKDKWVNEVDGGRLWQMNRPEQERGLDFALLPQLFFGANLDDPLGRNKGLKEQLDDFTYKVDVSLLAKEQVARFMYKFHVWLPTAIKDTEVTFRLKISALRNIYAQTQMYINFMKPLLKEISLKSEGLNSENLYRDFDMENPHFASLFDSSYAFIKVYGVRNFQKQGRNIAELEFTRYGLHIGGGNEKKEIAYGPHVGKSGFIFGEVKKGGRLKYMFIECSNKEISNEDFVQLKKKWEDNPVYVDSEDFRKYQIIENNFLQNRRTEMLETPQGTQQVPYMRNRIEYKAYVWNIYELASARDKLKEDDLKLMETFVSEVAQIKDDLLEYLNYFSDKDLQKPKDAPTSKSSTDWDVVTAPFKGFSTIVSPLIPKLNTKKKNKLDLQEENAERDYNHLIDKLGVLDDMWKCYYIFKKAHGFVGY